MKSVYTIVLIIAMSACSSSDEISDAYGNFEVSSIIVSAEANGKLLEFNLEEGQNLDANTLIGVIDTTDLILKQKQLKAQQSAISARIDNIRSQVELQNQKKSNLTKDKDRIIRMFDDGAATQKQLDDINGAIDIVDKQIESIQTQYVSVSSELEVINTQIEQIRESIRKSKIINPVSGVVLQKYTEPNEITSFGKPLYKIANVDIMTLRVYVSGSQLSNIKTGQEVEVLIDENEKANRQLSGIVSWISESAEFTPKIIQTKEERVNMVYAVKVRVKNDGTLKIGMPGEVNF